MDAHHTAERITSEVRNLLASLNKQNQESVVQDLAKYFDNGKEESILVIATCFDHFSIYEDNLGSTDVEPIIASLFRSLMQKPHFSLTFPGLVKNRRINEEFLDDLSTALKLSVGEKVGFGLSLLDSENDNVKIQARKFCMSQCEGLSDNDETLDTDALAEVLDVLMNLEQSEGLSKLVDSFKAVILEVWLNKNSRFILADKVPDVKLLSRTDFHIVDPAEMSAETSASRFSKMLGSWKQLSYHCGGLQTDGFQLRADVTFSLLMSCYKNTCQDPFPLAAVCGNVWEIPESQLLFLKQAVCRSLDRIKQHNN